MKVNSSQRPKIEVNTKSENYQNHIVWKQGEYFFRKIVRYLTSVGYKSGRTRSSKDFFQLRNENVTAKGPSTIEKKIF